MGKASRNMIWKYLAKRKGQDDLRPGDPLFATVDGKHFDRHGIAALVTRLGKRASVSNVHPHRFRHTAAIQFLRNGGNGFAPQKMLRHTDMEMTRRYVMALVNSMDMFTLQNSLGHSSMEMVRRYLNIAQLDISKIQRKASPVADLGL